MEICFVSQTPLSQDDELALMAGYAAAMDASMSDSSSTQDLTPAIMSGTSSAPEESQPGDGPTGVGQPPDDWESQTGEEMDHTSLSMCVSEASCKKTRGEAEVALTATEASCHSSNLLYFLSFDGRLFTKTICRLNVYNEHFC